MYTPISHTTEETTPAQELLKYLRSKSIDPLLRPVKNPNEAVQVEFGLQLQSLYLVGLNVKYFNIWLRWPFSGTLTVTLELSHKISMFNMHFKKVLSLVESIRI